jgi:hypothetical protein
MKAVSVRTPVASAARTLRQAADPGDREAGPIMIDPPEASRQAIGEAALAGAVIALRMAVLRRHRQCLRA